MPGLAEVASWRSASRPASNFKKRRQRFIRTHVYARLSRDQTHRELVYRPLQFHERSWHFIGANDETLCVVMMRPPNFPSSSSRKFSQCASPALIVCVGRISFVTQKTNPCHCDDANSDPIYADPSAAIQMHAENRII